MPERCLLYYITDRSAFPGDESARRKRLLEKIGEAARAAIEYIQLREKDLRARDLESLAREAVNVLTQISAANGERRTKLLINSLPDVALAAQAGGVHLRSDDVSPQDVRDIWKRCGADTSVRELSFRSPLIAVSCHTPAEVDTAALNKADFAVFAPVFEKKAATPAGLSILHQACGASIPVLALGGVTLSNAQSCLEAGAAGIAAIRLFQENDIADVAHRLRTL